MKKILISLIAFLVIFPMLFTTKVKAAALQITGLGTMDVSGLDLGGSLKSYTYTGGTFALAGLASPSAIVSVTIDDVSQTATADEDGSWSTLVSSLTEGQHQFNISSNAETLDFVLTIGASGTGGETEEVATTSGTLPEAGSTTTSILFLAFAMLSIGLGLTIRAKQS
jgi:hypothetical protein